MADRVEEIRERWADPNQAGYRDTAAPDDIAYLLGEVERLEKERQAMQQNSRVVTCVFCGNAYPPGTRRANHKALKAHVATCPKHPAATFRAERDEARRQRDAYREALLNTGRDYCRAEKCENPWTTRDKSVPGYSSYLCLEHAPREGEKANG